MIREHHTSDVVRLNCATLNKASSDISALNEGNTDKVCTDDKVDREAEQVVVGKVLNVVAKEKCGSTRARSER